jgi:syntaxin 18
MVDITPDLNQLLQSHGAPPTTDPALTLAHIDSFLKEAYEIVNLIPTLPFHMLINI